MCANETYITKDEARLVISTDLPKFNGHKEFKFDGFQYFTSVDTIPSETFVFGYGIATCKSIILPQSLKTIKVGNYFQSIIFNDGLESLNSVYIQPRSGEVTATIPNSLDISINNLYLNLNNIGTKFTIHGGALVQGTPKGDNQSSLNIKDLNKIFIDECPINLLFYKKENKYNYDNEIRYVRDEDISSLIYTCSTGGYFEDMSTQKTVNLTKVKDRVYVVENKVYYITVNITKNVENADFTIEYTNQEGEAISTVVKKGQHILPIKYGTNVKITPHDKANFVTPYVYTTNAKITLIQCDFKYTESTGIYIEHVNGTLYTADEWTSGNFSNNDANGVAVVRPITGSFVIAKEQSSTTLAWGGHDKTITDIFTSNKRDKARLDNGGASNTPKIIEQCTGYTNHGITGAPAAEYCASYTFPNGKTGYLGALGEWKAVYDNNTKIDSMLSLIGGTIISADDYHWTSTQYDSWDSWGVVLKYFMDNGRTKYEGKYYVRAFCLLSNN